MRDALLVFVGGGLGSVARYAVGLATLRAFGPGIPIGTFTVNVIGSFVMAVVVHFASRGLPDPWRLLLATGVLGGFTTYSSFNQETVAMVQASETSRAATYVVVTLLACWFAASVGVWLARTLAR